MEQNIQSGVFPQPWTRENLEQNASDWQERTAAQLAEFELAEQERQAAIENGPVDDVPAGDPLQGRDPDELNERGR